MVTGRLCIVAAMMVGASTILGMVSLVGGVGAVGGVSGLLIVTTALCVGTTGPMIAVHCTGHVVVLRGVQLRGGEAWSPVVPDGSATRDTPTVNG